MGVDDLAVAEDRNEPGSGDGQVWYLLMAVAVDGRTELALPSLSLYVAAYAVTNVDDASQVAVVERGVSNRA